MRACRDPKIMKICFFNENLKKLKNRFFEILVFFVIFEFFVKFSIVFLNLRFLSFFHYFVVLCV